MKVDIIMPALSDRPEFRGMTQDCIDSLFRSDPGHDFEVVVVESCRSFALDGHSYQGCKMVIPNAAEPFNYNRWLRHGLRYSSGAEWVVLCNNDLIFTKGWFTAIMHAYERLGREIKSFSPWDDGTHPALFKYTHPFYIGTRIAHEVAGWCLVVRRDILDKIHLDDRVDFWYSDNIYIDQLTALGEKHALIRDSEVYHLRSRTLNSLPPAEQRRITINQAIKYRN